MATLAEIRAKLKEQEANSGGNRGPSDNAVFPFWNMDEGNLSQVRFLPDGDSSNDYFWKERLMIKLPFAGVKGDTDSRPIIVQVPCMEMYGDACPVLTEVRPWFKDKSLEDMGRKYWKKRSYIFQALVTESGIKEDSIPENPVRRLVIGPQIFTLIKDALLDPELEEIPTDYTGGLDFTIKKGSKGGYADYSASKWARRERPLTDEEMAAVETHGLLNLSDFIPKKPDEAAVAVIKEMFEASVDGDVYDPDKWGQYFRPAGMAKATGDPVTPKADTPAPKQEHVDAPAQEAKPEETPPFKVDEKKADTGDDSAKDILAMIRSRQTG